jgi:hypothetical protein
MIKPTNRNTKAGCMNEGEGLISSRWLCPWSLLTNHNSLPGKRTEGKVIPGRIYEEREGGSISIWRPVRLNHVALSPWVRLQKQPDLLFDV